MDGGDKEDAGQEPAGVPLPGRGEGDQDAGADEGGQGAEEEARIQVQHPSVDIMLAPVILFITQHIKQVIV